MGGIPFGVQRYCLFLSIVISCLVFFGKTPRSQRQPSYDGIESHRDADVFERLARFFEQIGVHLQSRDQRFPYSNRKSIRKKTWIPSSCRCHRNNLQSSCPTLPAKSSTQFRGRTQ